MNTLKAWMVRALLAALVLAGIVWLLPRMRVYTDPAAWQAVLDAATGKDPYLAHHWNVSVFLVYATLLLFVVLELRRVVNRWDQPSPPALRRRQVSLIAVASLLLCLLLLMGGC